MNIDSDIEAIAPQTPLKSDMVGNHPLVTVSMPAFNAEKYIGEAIESILNQTYKNFELIIVDDGSTDGTRKIIERYSDPRIIKIFSDVNRSLITTRNHIVSIAKGKYLAFLDADDKALPNRLELQVEFLESGLADLCGADHLTLNQSTGILKQSKQRHTDSDIKALLTICSPLCNPAVMGKMEIFRLLPYKNTYLHAEDYCLWTEIALAGYRFANLKKNLIIYRLHSTQTSVNHFQAARGVFSNAQESYLRRIQIPVDCLPRPMNFSERISTGLNFMKLINQKIPNISIGANCELYARFQFRGNGLLTPFTRLERLFVATCATMLGRYGCL